MTVLCWSLFISIVLSQKIPYPSSKGLDSLQFPQRDQVPDPNASFLSKYNLSQIPSVPVSVPGNAAAPPSCNGRRDVGSNGSCHWTCNQCTRPSDIVKCPSNSDWGLTYGKFSSLELSIHTFDR